MDSKTSSTPFSILLETFFSTKEFVQGDIGPLSILASNSISVSIFSEAPSVDLTANI